MPSLWLGRWLACWNRLATRHFAWRPGVGKCHKVTQNICYRMGLVFPSPAQGLNSGQNHANTGLKTSSSTPAGAAFVSGAGPSVTHEVNAENQERYNHIGTVIKPDAEKIHDELLVIHDSNSKDHEDTILVTDPDEISRLIEEDFKDLSNPKAKYQDDVVVSDPAHSLISDEVQILDDPIVSTLCNPTQELLDSEQPPHWSLQFDALEMERFLSCYQPADFELTEYSRSDSPNVDDMLTPLDRSILSDDDEKCHATVALSQEEISGMQHFLLSDQPVGFTQEKNFCSGTVPHV